MTEIFVNSKCLADIIGEDELLSTDVIDVLVDKNGKEKVMKYADRHDACKSKDGSPSLLYEYKY